MNLKAYLKSEPLARERKNKNRAIGNILIKIYDLNISKDKMADIVGEVLTLDRQWRKILEECPELRGSDYEKKVELETLKQRELGYNV